MSTSPDLVFSPPAVSPTPQGYFGIAVAGGKDLSADGLDDMVIGQSALQNGSQFGRTYVFFGCRAQLFCPRFSQKIM